MEKKRVRFIDEPKEGKPVEFTHCLSNHSGWGEAGLLPGAYDNVTYLGRCPVNGDMFSASYKHAIHIYKGHLNSGYYE